MPKFVSFSCSLRHWRRPFFCIFRPKYLLFVLYFITVTVGVFLFLYLSSFTYLFISTEDPVNSKRILFTAGMVGDYSGLSTLYTYIHIYNIYIGDVKVRLEGRCLELSQYKWDMFQIVSLLFSSKPQQPKKISTSKTARITSIPCKMSHRYLN